MKQSMKRAIKKAENLFIAGYSFTDVERMIKKSFNLGSSRKVCSIVIDHWRHSGIARY